MKHLKYALVVFTLGTVPTWLFAATDPAPQNLQGLIGRAAGLVNPLLALLSAVGVLYFVWNVVRFIASAGDEKARSSAKDGIVYGLVGLFVLFSFWGLVAFLKGAVFG